MKPVQLLALFLAAGCARASAQTSEVQLQRPAAIGGTAEQAIMNQIERDIRLPRGADPLANYDRYYAWRQGADGARTVAGVYVSGNKRPGERRWVGDTDLPAIDDGGCSVVSLSYDVILQRIEQVSCNGYA